MNKGSVSKIVFLMVAALSIESAALAGANERKQDRNKKIASYEKEIANLKQKNTDDDKRLSNIVEIDKRISTISSMAVNTAKQADDRCKSIKEATNYVKTTKIPATAPFDGTGKSKLDKLKSLTNDTKKKASGLTCAQLDFIVPDEAPVASGS
jgi:vacuolar-type H+-ATPase subunit I/STV1